MSSIVCSSSFSCHHVLYFHFVLTDAIILSSDCPLFVFQSVYICSQGFFCPQSVLTLSSRSTVVPDEVKPKFVKGTKRYGRRSRPDIKSVGTLSQDSEDSAPSTTETTDYLQAGVRRAKLRRSTSLESVEVRAAHL